MVASHGNSGLGGSLAQDRYRSLPAPVRRRTEEPSPAYGPGAILKDEETAHGDV